MSKVLRFWCEDAQNIRCVREEDYDTAQSELAALREDLASLGAYNYQLNAQYERMCESHLSAERRNAELVECAEELADLVEAQLAGDYKPDSYTTQPIRAALAALKPTESGASE